MQIHHLRCFLLCFEAVSCLHINLAKSEMVPIGMVANIESMDGFLGCRNSSSYEVSGSRCFLQIL